MTIDRAASWAQVLWFGAVTIASMYGGLQIWFKIKAKLHNLENALYQNLLVITIPSNIG